MLIQKQRENDRTDSTLTLGSVGVIDTFKTKIEIFTHSVSLYQTNSFMNKTKCQSFYPLK